MDEDKTYDVAAIRNWCGVTHYAGCECHEKTRNTKLAEAVRFIALVASPKRPDGTYNHCREALEVKARAFLSQVGGK